MPQQAPKHDELAKELYENEMEIARRRARKGLLAFTKYTMPDFEVNWHHRLICQAVNAMLFGHTARQILHKWGLDDEEIHRRCKEPDKQGLYAGMTSPKMLDEPVRNIMLSVPPRFGKSELISRRFPPFAFGLNPDFTIIGASYSADLSSMMNRDTQRVITSPQYVDLFPKTRLNSSNVRSVADGSWLRNSDIYEIVGRRGVYRSAGVGGGVTGMGAHCAIVDDAIKNAAEAASPVTRDKIWDWYRSTLYTRLAKVAMQVLVSTRWHSDDLHGRVMHQAREDDNAEQFFCINFPAVLDTDPSPGDPREIGQALWPGKYDEPRMLRIKRTIGSRDWASLYQQRPAPEEGNIIRSHWWQRYRVLPDKFDEVIAWADLSFKGKKKSDFCAFQVWGRIGAKKYLLDQVRGRMAFTEQCRAYKKLCEKWPHIGAKLIEDAANAAAMIDTLKGEIPGLIAVPVHTDKVFRANAVAPTIEAGDVYLPEASIAPWINDYIAEWQVFPNGANDDQVDATTGALLRFATNKGWRQSVGAAPINMERTSRFKF